MRSRQAPRFFVSSATDQLTSWMKTDPDAALARHMVDVQRALAEFRQASEKRHNTSSQACRFDKHVPNPLFVWKRLSIYNWNPGLRRGKEDAFEKQIAGKWLVITLLEACEHVNHDILTNRFHVTHCGGCAVFFNNETFHPNFDIKSVYFHDTKRDLLDQIMEKRPGVGCARYWQYLFKKTEYARKLILTIRAIMISQQVDLLAGDFNGVACRSSTKLLRTALCQRRRALLWGPISIRNNWADVCGAP